MAEKYYSILTNRGKELEAAAAANGTSVVLKDFVIGDGNGQAVTPDPTRTQLVREVYRGAVSLLEVSPDQTNQFIAHLVIPEKTGGFTVREAGLLTDAGELYAVANCAAIEKPTNGISVNLQFRLAVSETASIELKVSTGDGLFLRQDKNLSDLGDKVIARTNLGLGGLAIKEIGYIYDSIYPVGVVTWFAQNKNPNTLFPGTKWNYIGENRTIRLASASGSDVMATGGSDSVKLAVGNLPVHGHTFSANTNSFDYGTKTTSKFDYSTKTTSGFDYGSKTTSSAGNHKHRTGTQGSLNGGGGQTTVPQFNNGTPTYTDTVGNHTHTIALGSHSHTVAIGAHAHTVGIGAHSHSVSGTTANTGSGSDVNVTNSFIKLMGWYRSA